MMQSRQTGRENTELLPWYLWLSWGGNCKGWLSGSLENLLHSCLNVIDKVTF